VLPEFCDPADTVGQAAELAEVFDVLCVLDVPPFTVG
jgi:hypothetical protein